MAAPDMSTVYQFEDQIETGVATALETAGIAPDKQQGAAVLSTPRAALQLSTGQTTGHEGVLPDGTARYDAWHGVLKVQIVSDRSKNASSHKTNLGLVRSVMHNFRAAFPRSVLPYHEIAEVRESSTSPSIAAENNLDLSEVTFAIQFRIRPEAWPQQ